MIWHYPKKICLKIRVNIIDSVPGSFNRLADWRKLRRNAGDGVPYISKQILFILSAYRYKIVSIAAVIPAFESVKLSLG